MTDYHRPADPERARSLRALKAAASSAKLTGATDAEVEAAIHEGLAEAGELTGAAEDRAALLADLDRAA